MSLNKSEMIDALATTGTYLAQHARGNPRPDSSIDALTSTFFEPFEELIRSEHTFNGWFTEPHIRNAIGAIAGMLEKARLEEWMQHYPELPVDPPGSKTVGVIMAGNIPLVGFHDLLSVVISGHAFLGKPSSKDDHLLRQVAGILCAIEPRFGKRIAFTDEYLRDAEALIATGSDNSARHFSYYFRNIPHIIRRNRNGIAILSGRETDEELLLLGRDIFTYFGLGCRNVTKIYVPDHFDVTRLLRLYEDWPGLTEHHKYNNNLDYHRTIFLMKKLPFLDNGLVLFREDEAIGSPVGVVYYEKYSELNHLNKQIQRQSEQVQCVVSTMKEIDNAIPPGTTQEPGLADYADGVDTLEFLKRLTD